VKVSLRERAESDELWTWTLRKLKFAENPV
jgi:hypothetical protein